jgi:hypothetical protein
MTRGTGDYWAVGSRDLGRRAAQLATAGIDVDVVLVQLSRDAAEPADPERENEALAALWQAGTDADNGDIHGRRLSWRSFVLLVAGDARSVRESLAHASTRLQQDARQSEWRVAVCWLRSTGDFIADVQRLESEARLELA